MTSSKALAVLRDARSTDALIAELRAASEEGLSVVSSSPFRRRHGEHQRQLAELVEPLDVALRNTRVVVRRVAVACYRREPVPASYASLMRDLADLSDRVADELVADRMADGGRRRPDRARARHGAPSSTVTTCRPR